MAWAIGREGVFINSVDRRSYMLNPRLGPGWRFPLVTLEDGDDFKIKVEKIMATISAAILGAPKKYTY